MGSVDFASLLSPWHSSSTLRDWDITCVTCEGPQTAPARDVPEFDEPISTSCCLHSTSSLRESISNVRGAAVTAMPWRMQIAHAA